MRVEKEYLGCSIRESETVRESETAEQRQWGRRRWDEDDGSGTRTTTVRIWEWKWEWTNERKGSDLGIYSSPNRRRLDLLFFFFFTQNHVPAGLFVLAGTAETGRNTPKSSPRWNGGVSGTGLHADTKNSVRSGRNGTELITMIWLQTFYISYMTLNLLTFFLVIIIWPLNLKILALPCSCMRYFALPFWLLFLPGLSWY